MIALRHKRPFRNHSLRDATATANRPSDRGGKPSISNIGLQLRENSLIVDQLAASIITLLAQLSGSRERKGFDWKTFAGLGRKGYGNQ